MPATFEDWLADSAQRLVRLASAISGSPDLAQDLVQDVVLKVHQRWPTISALTQRDAYVRRMLVNEHLSFRRRFARLSYRPDDLEPPADHAPGFDQRYADRRALVEELRRLPLRQRTVLVLRYFEGLDDPEIADLMGCRPSTVRSYATRALATLRVHAARDDDDDESSPPDRRGEDTRAYRE